MSPFRKGLFASALCTVAGVSALSVTPPAPILRNLVRVASGRLLSPDASKLFGTYFEFALAGKMARTVAAHGDQDDVARIDYALRRTQLRTLNQSQVPHTPHDWPVLVAGFGWCDQINAAAAQVLAHSFEHAQLFALYDPQTRTSPHTVGRVWSGARQEWLYFDAFFDRPVVYRRVGRGQYEILNSPKVLYPSRNAPPGNIYGLDGWVMNEYPPAYAEYLVKKTMERFQAQAPPEAAAPPLVARSDVVARSLTAPGRDDLVYKRIASLYVQARADDILGDRERARRTYMALAEDPGAARDGRAKLLSEAAREFARR